MKNIFIGCFMFILIVLVSVGLAGGIMNAIRIMLTNTL